MDYITSTSTTGPLNGHDHHYRRRIGIAIDLKIPKHGVRVFHLVTFIIMLIINTMTTMAQVEETAAIRSNSHLSPQILKLWNDPVFQKQFAESYMAETENEPRVTEDERDQMRKVMELIAADKLEDALSVLKKETARNKAANAIFDFTIANIYFQQDQLDQAAAAYTVAVEKFPKFRRAWKNMGLIYIRQGEFVKAQPALTRVVELGAGDAVTYGLMGYAYSSMENFLSAESAYRMAILMDPVTLDWKMGLARSLFKQERYAEAVTLCEQLIEEHPDKADLWLLQANAYIGLNQAINAAEIFELVDHLGKSTADSLNMLGDIYVNEDLFGLSANAYTRAMEIKTENGSQHAIGSAKLLAARGAFREARQLIEHIERKYGDKLDATEHKDVLKIHARLAVAEGAGGEELRVLEEIVALDPLDGEALILLGQNSARNGDSEKAILYYERAAAIEASEAEAKVNEGQLLVRNGKYEEALPLLRRAQQIKPRDNLQDYILQMKDISITP